MPVKNILITGGTSGLGLALANMFHHRGSRVWVTGRTRNDALNSKVELMLTDFADLSALRETANLIISRGVKFSIIINNAAAMGPASFTLTRDGFEYSYQVNFISHLFLNDILLGNTDDKSGTILGVVTSPVFRYVKPSYRMPAENEYSAFRAYAESKYYLLLAADYMHEKHREKTSGVIRYNPGIFGSGIFRTRQTWLRKLYSFATPLMRSPEAPAGKLIELIERSEPGPGKVYKSIEHKGEPAPVLNDTARSFLKSLEAAVKAVD